MELNQLDRGERYYLNGTENIRAFPQNDNFGRIDSPTHQYTLHTHSRQSHALIRSFIPQYLHGV